MLVSEPSGKPGKHVSNKRGLWLFIPLATDKVVLSSAMMGELKWGFTEIRDRGDPQGSSLLYQERSKHGRALNPSALAHDSITD